MTPAGTVIGATMVVNHGADVDHFVLVVVAEGFTAAEQAAFETAVDDFLAVLQATAPYDDPGVWQRINVYRLDVHSTQSGADNPLACADDPAGYVPLPPEVAGTYFDAEFCTGGIRRLLTLGEKAQLLLDLDTYVPAWDAVVVAVNHLEYGGSGDGANNIAVYSLDALAGQIAVHELGHALDLADEYDAGGPDTYAGAEPPDPNVTTDVTAAKWASFVTTANLPTWSSSDCAVSNEGVADPEPGAVGLYEGAAYSRCGIYRPMNDCYMRHLGIPFCVVCEAHIRDYLATAFPSDTSGCFVASAVYADPGHPDVEVLRRWRDRRLEPGARGRWAMVLVAGVYRRLGPACARFTRPRRRLAAALRRLLFAPAAAMLRRGEARRRR
ncbi:MAG TPA: M64 family metallopeptidase [Gaiellaceae bacterium]|nr:M64 family metallopeptidase [Gaiellaceae bacterium]